MHIQVQHQVDVFLYFRRLWQIGFVISSSSVKSADHFIHPVFVQLVTEKLLEPDFSVTGLSKRKYELYLKAYDMLAVFRRSYAFTLVFSDVVYVSDWVIIEDAVKSQWCHGTGNLCLCVLYSLSLICTRIRLIL